MIHVLGATGFIGKEIFNLFNSRSDVCFYSSKIDVSRQGKFKYFSLDDEEHWEDLNLTSGDKIVFLCWKNLPNYQKDFHMTENLPKSLRFFAFVKEKKCKKIVIAGTCYEYGIQNGELSEDIPTKPINSYSVAKDSLRKLSEELFKSSSTEYAWLRIFYPYGSGQNPNSLIPSLDRAIRNGEEYFGTSPGDQIRDFIHVSCVAKAFLKIVDADDANGIFNVGSGTPISIRDFLEKYIRNAGSSIKLRLGAYPRRSDEPLAFWADCSKLNSI